MPRLASLLLLVALVATACLAPATGHDASERAARGDAGPAHAADAAVADGDVAPTRAAAAAVPDEFAAAPGSLAPPSAAAIRDAEVRALLADAALIAPEDPVAARRLAADAARLAGSERSARSARPDARPASGQARLLPARPVPARPVAVRAGAARPRAARLPRPAVLTLPLPGVPGSRERGIGAYVPTAEGTLDAVLRQSGAVARP